MLSGKNFMEDKLDLADHPAPDRGRRSSRSCWRRRSSRACRRRRRYSSASPFCSPLWQDDDHCVDNAEGGGAGGKVDLWTATEDSINVVFAQLILDIGPETVPPVAIEDGHHRPSCRRWPSLATGSAEVSPLDMAVGYATLANGGIHCTPYTVETILRDGKELYEHEADCERVLQPDIAHLISAMLERVPQSGTAASAFCGRMGRVAGRGQDGHRQPQQGRVVLRLHPAGRHRGLGGIERHAVLARLGVRRHGRGADLALYMIRVMARPCRRSRFPDPPPPPTPTVPDVVGMTSDEAIAALQAAGFNATHRRGRLAAARGIVVASCPAGGAQADLGLSVTIDVSNGKAPESRRAQGGGPVDAAPRAPRSRTPGFVVKVASRTGEGPEGGRRSCWRRSPAGGDAGAQGHRP